MTVNINGTSGVSGVDGTAGTPALQGTDSNTGISFGTDTVNINTGGTTRATVDSSGRVLVGTSSARSVGVGSAYPSRLQIETTAYAGLSIVNNTNDGNGAILAIGKSRGTAAGGITSVNNGDEIGVVRFAAADGTDLESISAQISCEADGGVSGNDVPGRLVFSVTADGASSPTERMRITSDGSFSYTQTPGKFTVDTSPGQTVVANNGTVDFTSFSGLIMVNNYSVGGVQVWLAGGGGVTSLGSVSAGTGTLAYNAGVNGYRWTNNSGSSSTFGFYCVRTRPAA